MRNNFESVIYVTGVSSRIGYDMDMINEDNDSREYEHPSEVRRSSNFYKDFDDLNVCDECQRASFGEIRHDANCRNAENRETT